MNTTKENIIVLSKTTVAIENERQVLLLKQLVNEHAVSVKMGLLNQTKLITATSELVHNLIKYGGGGQVLIETISQDVERGIRITFTDKGPGIADIPLVMQDGYSTGNTLGIGLPGAKRLVNEFFISSEVNKGATITIIKWADA